MENGCAGVMKPVVSHVLSNHLTVPLRWMNLSSQDPWACGAGDERIHYLSFGVGREIKKGIYLRSGPIATRMRNETLVISVGRSI